MLWIIHRKDPIPKELTYDGWQSDKTAGHNTPLMLWIMNRKEPIPEDMFYDGW